MFIKKLLFPFFLLGVSINFVFASWYVLHGDIAFPSEIGRDFLLLRELDEKKIVLIGPSSSSGLFHGPLWSYINYPAYLVSSGNPVVVGWWWIVLCLIFVVSNYFIAKKLFNKTVAILFTMMSSLYISFHSKEMYNPHGALLLIPAFLFFFIMYQKTKRIRFLIIHIVLGGCIIQFQMAIGIPFMILSFLWIALFAVKHKKILHVFSYLLTPVMLGNFIFFDLRHNFIISKLVFHFLGSGERTHPSLQFLLSNRINLMFSSVELLRADPGGRNLVLFLILLAFIAIQIKTKKYRLIYISFLYFYFGFFVLSMVNVGGPLLYFYLFPLFPLVFLIFSSFATSKLSPVFFVLFILLYLFNVNTAISDINLSSGIIGKSQYSWKFLKTAANQIYSGPEQKIGYFVYSPNVVAYEGKYAMWYVGKKHGNKADYFTKEPITYLLIAPPPPNNPYMKDEWWTQNQVKIEKKPVQTIRYENGYKIEKYLLSSDDIKIPFDHGIDPGLIFR